MNAKNLNGMPDHRANLSRTGFDMSQEFAFTSSVGMILPVYQDFLNVGESVHFSGDLITRTQPLVTAAMCDIDIWLDWFFVPVSMLFTLFPSKRWLTNDFISDFYNSANSGDDKFPVFDITRYLTGDGTQEWNDPVPVLYPNSPYADTNFERVYKSQFRLANHFGFNPYAIFHGSGDVKTDYASMNNPNVFPIFPLAYQAIFQDYYRLPLDNFVRRDVKSFNVDSYYNQVTSAVYDTNKSLFELHYRPRHFDYFTGFKPSPLLSDVNSSVGSADLTSLLSKADSYLSSEVVNVLDASGSSASVSNGTQTSSPMNSDYEFGSAQLRNMFAIEKLMRVTGRAKKDYDSQVLAHFGFKVPHDVKHELTHICQQHSILHIGEVISTSDTFDGSNGSSLGAIGGKGYGVINSKKPYRFTAPVDGVFMCCYSSAPRQRYFGTFDKQNNIVDRLSLYQPEFDKLGMQPLFSYESAGFRDDESGERIGWQYRYEQWKRKYNRVSEAFAAPGIHDQVINNNVSWVNATRPFASAFGYAPTSASVGQHGSGLFVQPTDINQIMVVPYQPTMPEEALQNAPVMFYTDPFIHAYRANVKKVSVMSSFGEPDLNGI